jgi:hypothetical protein
MKADHPVDDLELRATQILEEVLAMSDEEVISSHAAAYPEGDSKQRLFELADTASKLCAEQGRKRPSQLEEVRAQTAQLEIPLDGAIEHIASSVLLIDSVPARALGRRTIFASLGIHVEITSEIEDGIAKLERGGIGFGVVDFEPRTTGEQRLLTDIQLYNLRVPMINVGAWVHSIKNNERSLNRDLLRAVARLFGKAIPKRLPQRRPPNRAELHSDSVGRSKVL